MEILSTIIGAIIGYAIAFKLIGLIEKAIAKRKDRKLKADLTLLIHDNRHLHPANILTKVEKYLEGV